MGTSCSLRILLECFEVDAFCVFFNARKFRWFHQFCWLFKPFDSTTFYFHMNEELAFDFCFLGGVGMDRKSPFPLEWRMLFSEGFQSFYFGRGRGPPGVAETNREGGSVSPWYWICLKHFIWVVAETNIGLTQFRWATCLVGQQF